MIKFDKFLHPVVLDVNDLFCIFMNIYENLKNDRKIIRKTRNVSMGHGCPRYCQIHINRALSLTKGHNSDNNQLIVSMIELDLYLMTIYLCMKYESNTPMFQKISPGNHFSYGDQGP